MKKFRIVSLLLIVVVLFASVLSCVSCTKKVSITCTLEVVNEDGEVIYGPYNVTVDGTEDDWPTALDAAQQAFLEYDIPYEVTSDGNSIASINGVAEEEYTDDEYGYYSYWNLLIDGKESSEGRQSLTKFYDGEKLQFVYTSSKTARKDNITSTTDTAEAE
jgi:hypothetical protein